MSMRYLRARYANILSPKVSAKTFVSEVIGVFAFVLLGCGAATLCNAPGVYPPESPRMVKVRLRFLRCTSCALS
jgi:hypothetical protein